MSSDETEVKLLSSFSQLRVARKLQTKGQGILQTNNTMTQGTKHRESDAVAFPASRIEYNRKSV